MCRSFGRQNFKIHRKVQFETVTERGYVEILDEFHDNIEQIFQDFPQDNLKRIGISCGGPLDSKKGIIYSPPNLPGWDNVPIVQIFSRKIWSSGSHYKTMPMPVLWLNG